MKTILSLFDSTGTWSAPFWDAGWNVIQVDLDHGIDVNDFTAEYLTEELCADDLITGILAAPPCTDFTAAGARWWPDKDANGRTEAAAELVRQTCRTIELLKPDWWAMENPPGRLQRVIPWVGEPTYHFDPCDFAGYLQPEPGDAELAAELAAIAAAGNWKAVTPAMVELTKRRNLYTKKTALWGHFPTPTKRLETPLKVCAAGSWLMRLSGKNPETQALRSETPAGFAQAFFEAVEHYTLDWDAIEEGEAEYHSFT